MLLQKSSEEVLQNKQTVLGNKSNSLSFKLNLCSSRALLGQRKFNIEMCSAIRAVHPFFSP